VLPRLASSGLERTSLIPRAAPYPTKARRDHHQQRLVVEVLGLHERTFSLIGEEVGRRKDDNLGFIRHATIVQLGGGHFLASNVLQRSPLPNDVTELVELASGCMSEPSVSSVKRLGGGRMTILASSGMSFVFL
jgi:hypothetical protein